VDFFARQRQVRRLSGRLVLLFVAAVVVIVAMVDLVVAIAFGAADMSAAGLVGLMVVTSLLTLAVIGLASLVRTVTLRGGGGGRVAQELGGVPVPPDTRDPHLRRLRNVVEEMAIASGVPVPAIYVLDHEEGINAFAAGWSPADAAVAVTRGALLRLNRDELQGVIAHEFSHVTNGDMRLNLRLMGLLFGILVLAVGGRLLLYTGGGRDRDGRNPLPLIGIALLVAGYGGVLAGRLIKAAVSRQREYLADASAVQFTRQTAGLTGALKKIAGLSEGSKLRSAKGEEVSHMLFGSGTGLSSLFATHPPLLKRIQVLDPSVNVAELEAQARGWAQTPPSGLAEDAALGLAGRDSVPGTGADASAGTGGSGPDRAARTGAGGAEARGGGASGPGLAAADSTVAMRPADVVEAVAAPTEAAYRQAETLLDAIPDELLAAARRPEASVPLVLGLLLSSYDDGRANQLAQIAARHGPVLADAVDAATRTADGLHPALRLPLAEVAFAAVRARPRPEQEALLATVHEVVRSDGRMSVFEYCLSRLLHRELYELLHRRTPWRDQRDGLAAGPAAALLLAALAQVGHDDETAAAQAFAAGMARFAPGRDVAYAPPPQGPVALESVWAALDGLRPADKSALVESMVLVIAADGVLTVAEVELLRTVCAVLGCPLPPLPGVDA
jgi:Zn-dependent protease with chaperone function